MIASLNRKGKVFPWWTYWVFFGFYGFLLLLFEEGHDEEDSYVVALLVYMLLLFLVLARWIFNQIKQIIELNNQKTKIELVHLQSQVNPHFFFNILNNLYGWVEKDPKQAQEMILKLSDMMRYSIYDGQKEFVTLEEEIAYLKNYIELHKMRYRKKIDIFFDIAIDDQTTRIRPLLFIILLENAFKHGVENLRENAFVKIELVIKNGKLYFTIENNFDAKSKLEETGIGLKNLTRRLELVYPKKHSLSTSTKFNIYKANLTLNLS